MQYTVGRNQHNQRKARTHNTHMERPTEMIHIDDIDPREIGIWNDRPTDHFNEAMMCKDESA